VTADPVDKPAPAEKSEAQLLLDRMLAQCNRFNRIRKRLIEVRGSIAAPKLTVQPASEPSSGRAAKPTSFFAGLNEIADGNDRAADELEKSVEDLAKLF
jgi:hypothetical protein